MADEQEERKQIEEYLNHHHLQAYLNDAVNEIARERPRDPLLKLADVLRDSSDVSRKIQKVRGRQILNGEGLPALEVEIQTEQVQLLLLHIISVLPSSSHHPHIRSGKKSKMRIKTQFPGYTILL